jgi:8-oxo-dGTP pyrophosphatase MutT (NUDIX family)
VSAPDTPVPADSAAVILLREAGGRCEVLLVERHARSRAFAGAHVFPGGLVETGDREPAVAASPAGAAASAPADPRGDDALPFRIAAIRELFEEAGVLLASARDRSVDLAEPACEARLAEARVALLDGRLTFAELVARERLEPASDALVYVARWITPAGAPRRFDTRFFLASLPPGQRALHDRRETTAARWLAPARALAEAAAGRITLAPPTHRTLEDLAVLGSIDRILETARTRAVTPILPKMVDLDGRPAVLLPGDADYDRTAPGGSLAGAPAGPLDRIVLEGGTWRSLRRGAAG